MICTIVVFVLSFACTIALFELLKSDKAQDVINRIEIPLLLISSIGTAIYYLLRKKNKIAVLSALVVTLIPVAVLTKGLIDLQMYSLGIWFHFGSYQVLTFISLLVPIFAAKTFFLLLRKEDEEIKN